MQTNKMMLGDISNSKTFTSVEYVDQITVQREDGFVRVGTILCPTAFFNTVESLTTNKVVAICEMGFGALQLIGCPKLYPKVCQLMVEGLDPLNETVRIHGKNFVIKSSDFARIMGIKDGGTDIDLCGDLTATIFQHLTKRLAAGAGEITISSLKHIVGERIAVDRDFKVGYVLFAMSSLLCPGGADEVDKTLLLTLTDTMAIRGKNWATYCFNKLLSGVLTFKSNNSGSLSGCMIFLQLFYFETVGGSSGWVDRMLTPLLSWGDAEVRELVAWVEQRGGIRSSNASVWAISIGSKKRLTPPTDVSQLESQSGLAYFDMCSLRSDLDALAREFVPLQQSVVKMEPTVAELIITADRIERSISTFPEVSIRLIVVEVLKHLNYSQNPQSEYRPDSATGIPPTYAKNQHESHAGNDGKASQPSEDPSVMFLYERNRNNGLPDELQVGLWLLYCLLSNIIPKRNLLFHHHMNATYFIRYDCRYHMLPEMDWGAELCRQCQSYLLAL